MLINVFPKMAALLLISSSLITLVDSPSIAGKNRQTFNGGTSTINCNNGLETGSRFPRTRVHYTLQTRIDGLQIALVDIAVNFDGTQTIRDRRYIVPPKSRIEGRVDRPESRSELATLSGKAYRIGIRGRLL